MNQHSIRERIEKRFPPPLKANEVHAWVIHLAGEGTVEPDVLSAEERARAARFHRDEDRQRYVRSHIALRVILAHYLKVAPSEIAFETEPLGKPIIRPDRNPLNLSFNLAHSSELAVVALTLGRRVGVDVEAWRSEAVEHAVMQRFCTTDEVEAIQRSAADARPAAFFRCWTRKEAYLKAVGCGLVDEVRDVQVWDGKDGTTAGLPGDLSAIGAGKILKTLPERLDAVQRWAVYDLAVPGGYSGAVVVADADSLEIRTFKRDFGSVVS